MIRRIICTLRLDHEWVASQLGVDPRERFADAFAELEPMVADGLVEVDHVGLRVTPLGRVFLRNVCMPFDAYLKQPTERPVYSRTV